MHGRTEQEALKEFWCSALWDAAEVGCCISKEVLNTLYWPGITQMLFKSIFRRTVPNHYTYASSLSQLKEIGNKQINIAIHEREPSPGLEASVMHVMASSFTGMELLLDSHESIASSVGPKLVARSHTSAIAIQPLIEDIEMLAFVFSDICRARHLKLYLKTVSNDACRKFHVDGYDLRLICSYAGPGTEWTYNENVNRKYLGEGENEQIIKDWGCVKQLKSYDVAVLKGELPHKRTGNGIVHRSPAIEQKCTKRLVLRMEA